MENALTTQDWTQVSEIELVYKTKIKASQRPMIQTSADIYQLLLQNWNKDVLELQEQFKVLLLNRANRVLGIYQASAGGVTSTVADPRLILAAAIKSAAIGIILCHNHPSSNLKPSRHDEMLTLKILEAAKYHDIKLLDHVIITAEGYFSFADEGLL